MSQATIPVSKKKQKELQQMKRRLEAKLQKDLTWDDFFTILDMPLGKTFKVAEKKVK